MIEKKYDLLVIGGGITGAGIARIAAENGLKVILIDNNDFASGTSSKSSKLIHGGLRYLETYDFHLVHHASKERNILQQSNPEFVEAIPFYIPVYKNGLYSKLFLRLGMLLYDFLSLYKNKHLHKWISKDELISIAPNIKKENLLGAFEYVDASVDDARLVIENIKEAVLYGADVFNYVSDFSFVKFTPLQQAKFKFNNNEHYINFKHVINASGIHLDKVRALANPSESHQDLVLSSGIHLILNKASYPINKTLTLYSSIDKRPLFLIDWNDFILYGTTDKIYTNSDLNGIVEQDQVDYLIENFNLFFPDNRLEEKDIVGKICGIRPLIKQKNVKTTKSISREHHIYHDKNGMLSISGGKLTTYRLMALDVLKLIYPKTSLKKSHFIFSELKAYDINQLAGVSNSFKYLIKRSYANRLKVMNFDKNWNEQQWIRYLFNYALDNEYCTNITDFFTRRFRLALWSKEHGLNFLNIISEELLKRKLSEVEIVKQIEAYKDHLKTYYL